MSLGPSKVIGRLLWIMEEHLGGKQNALAEALGCKPPYVSGMIKGKKNNPSRKLLENLVNSPHLKGSGVTLEWLEMGVGREPTQKGKPLLKGAPADMNEMRLLEYRRAISFIVQALGDAQLEKLYADLWKRGELSVEEKHIVSEAVLTEKSRREKTVSTNN